MNHEVLFRLVIGSMFLSTLALGQSQVKAQNETEATLDSAITYAQTARQLLNQTMVEYSTNNATGAEELATRAYLDNFEYVEPALEQKGAADLKEQIEDMMREEIRDMIKTSTSADELHTLINATDAKLVEAISILNGTGD
jgi:DNA primase